MPYVPATGTNDFIYAYGNAREILSIGFKHIDSYNEICQKKINNYLMFFTKFLWWGNMGVIYIQKCDYSFDILAWSKYRLENCSNFISISMC